jgi:hypothetical protein
MAINKNHEFDDLQGVKCAIVEKNVSQSRAEFLKKLLEFNEYTVVLLPVVPAQNADAAAPANYTVGVSDVTFSMVSAIFGRRLKTEDGHIVSLAYWQQKETVSHDEVPYFEKRG